MKIIQKDINSLKEYKNNPRYNENAINAVANSIQDFGFKVPIVIDANNEIVCGHTRFKASKKLGLKTVPCVIADDLTEEQIKAFRLADNRVAEMATWNEEKLTKEIKDGVEKLERYGFNEYQLEAYAEEKNLSELFEDDDREKKEKEYVCPHCGKVFAKKKTEVEE